MLKRFLKLFILILTMLAVPVSAEDVLLISDLEMLDKNTTGAATEYVVQDMEEACNVGLSVVDGTFDNGFVLKYQLEFRSNVDIPANGVEIRVPLSLLTYDDGTPFYPSAIGVPVAEEDEKEEGKIKVTADPNSPFNARIEEIEGEEGVEKEERIVFFNYTDITAGTDAVWQVVYGDLVSSMVADGAEWAFQAVASVTADPEGEAVEIATDLVSGVIPPAGDSVLQEGEVVPEVPDVNVNDQGDPEEVPDISVDSPEEEPGVEDIEPEEEPGDEETGSEPEGEPGDEEAELEPEEEPGNEEAEPGLEEESGDEETEPEEGVDPGITEPVMPGGDISVNPTEFPEEEPDISVNAPGEDPEETESEVPEIQEPEPEGPGIEEPEVPEVEEPEVSVESDPGITEPVMPGGDVTVNPNEPPEEEPDISVNSPGEDSGEIEPEVPEIQDQESETPSVEDPEPEVPDVEEPEVLVEPDPENTEPVMPEGDAVASPTEPPVQEPSISDVDALGSAGATTEYVERFDDLIIEGRNWKLDFTAEEYETVVQYRMELRTNFEIPAYGAEIRVPEALFVQNDGTPCNPAEIGVPLVYDRESYMEVPETPFNCLEENTENGSFLVFFNYRDIPAGTDAVWHVIYRDFPIPAADVDWSLQPIANITYIQADEYLTETENLFPVTGHIKGAKSLVEDSGDIQVEVGPAQGDWTFDVFYIGDTSNDFYAEDDFSLTYQMQFDTSRDIPANGVSIRIPRTLLTYRNGDPVVPSNITVPVVDSRDQASVEAVFNCCFENEYLLFFNCQDIPSGTHSEWQVSYDNLRAVEIPDETEWSLQADATLEYMNQTEPVFEIAQAEPLTGRINTKAELASLTEELVDIDPGSLITLPEGYQQFKVMRLTVTGGATQSFDLHLQNSLSLDGSAIVGIVDAETGEVYTDTCHISPDMAEWMKSFLIIIGIPAGVDENLPLYNTATVTLVPADQRDVETSLTTQNEWAYFIEDDSDVQDVQSQTFEVVNECQVEIPDFLKKQNLEFHISGNDGIPFIGIPYRVYSDDETVEDFTTTESGNFYLRIGQKAGFDIAGQVEVVENPYWESSVQEDAAGLVRVVNTPRPVLYVQNEVESDTEKAFKFSLLINDQPAVGVRYWLVDAIYTDGRIPEKISEGVTGENGEFELHAGETAAFIRPGEFGDSYSVTAVGSGKNWVSENDSGTLSIEGSSAIITTFSRWKDLEITRTVSRQDPEDVKETVFRVELIENETVTPVQGNEWEMISDDGEVQSSGVLDENGEFTALQGTTVIHRLELGKKYRITEISPEGYSTVGSQETEMPQYSDSAKVSFEDEWLRRSLTVKNDLVIDYDDPQDVELSKSAVFELTVEQLPDTPFTLIEDGKKVKPGSKKDPYGPDNTEFKTDGNGMLKMNGNQTAVFEDVGVEGDVFTVTETPNEFFAQISPDGQAEGIMDDEGCTITIVNGSEKFFTIREDWNGLDKVGKAFIKAADASVLSSEITMTVTDENLPWPSEDTEIMVVDDNGDVSNDVWEKESPYELMPGKTLVINRSQLEGAESYKVQESIDDINVLKNWTDEEGEKHIVQILRQNSDEDGAITGSPETEPEVDILKTAGAFTEKSRIGVRYVDPSTPVPEFETENFRLEVYKNGIWDSANGVNYYAGCGDAVIGGMRQTGTYGEAVMETNSDGLPWISFPDNIVYAIDVKNVQEGDMRLRHDPNHFPTLGYTVGKGSSKNDGSYTFALNEFERYTGQAAECIVNTFDEVSIKIGKVEDGGETGQDFTFDLNSIIEIDGALYDADSGITESNYESVIQEILPGPYYRYAKYKTADNSLISTGNHVSPTFSLKGGEYIVLYLPAYTCWIINENPTNGYQLESLEEFSTQTDRSKDSDYLRKIDDGAILVGDRLIYHDPGVIQLPPTAVLFADGTMIFYEAPPEDFSSQIVQHGAVTGSWTGWDTDIYTDYKEVPWYEQASNVKSVEMEGTIAPISTAYWFYGFDETLQIDLDNLVTDNITNMTHMFVGCEKLSGPLDLSGWNTSKVTDMERMFYFCTSLTSIGDVSNWDVSKVTNLSGIFANCYLIPTFGDLGKWDVSSVTNMMGMFSSCREMTYPGDLSSWETKQVTTMRMLFDDCRSMTGMGDISRWNTSNVTNMSGMFNYCKQFDTFDIGGWDTSKVTDMSEMFRSCISLTRLDLSRWNTGEVTEMDYMFRDCMSLSELDLSKWNTGKVTNVDSMFRGCLSLIKLDLSNWDVGAVILMGYFFADCPKLITTGNLDNWNVGNVKYMNYMFSGCEQLTSVGDLSTWNVSKVESMGGMFKNCKSLTTVGDLRGWDVSSVPYYSEMFEGSYPGLADKGPIFS